jgi:hypothetical protein
MANRPITSQPDSMNPSAPVNNAPNAPAQAMSQEIYSASVESQMMARRHAMRKNGAVRGKPFVPPEDQGG